MNSYIKNILDKQIENGRLAHAYLFVGPKFVDKIDLVLGFAKKIIASENLKNHPDFSELDCLDDISIEMVRDFIGRIALRPFVAKKKFALISNIENLNIQSSNALLKTLEEPAENTVLVLTANTRRVLSTIVSRCQVFNINYRLIKDLKRKNNESAQIIDYAGKSLSERLLAINKFAELEEVDFKQVIENFVYDSAESLFLKPQKYNYLSAGLKAYEDLNTNKNKKLILQGLFMKI